MQKPIISCKNLEKTFITVETKTFALRGVSCDIHSGEFVAIMGPSGSGKSTLMHLLSFLDRPTAGKYLFDGKDASQFEDDALAQIRNQKIGFVFQAFNLLSRVSVYENVEIPLLYNFYDNKKEKFNFKNLLSKTKHKDKIEKTLKNVGMLHRIDYLARQLSGGEKQRVAIARALVNDPEIIFADEPTGNLDSKSGLQVMETLQDLNNKGKTIILVTHEENTAKHATRILHVRDGLIEEDEKVIKRIIAKNENGLLK
ncbi:MAG: ABC transporter ATP-binding protein [Candidatus Moranbacteria bacterium]|nr:ABC transporter ATP-binding protein [Candidatus Moranbacteria bacterium]